MPSNFVGDETHAAQAPSAKPEPEADITLALPVDGETLNVSSVHQAFKAIADFIDYLMHPRAKAALTPHFLRRYLTRVGQVRWALDRVGLPAATYLHRQETWGQPFTQSGSTGGSAVDMAADMGNWLAKVSSASGAVIVQIVSGFSNAAEIDSGDGLNDYAGIWSPMVSDFGSNTDMALEAAVNGVAAFTDLEVIFGLVRRDTTDPRTTQGLRFVAAGGSNWYAVSTGPSGETSVDTTVAPTAGSQQRLRIEYRGANCNDGGAGGAYFFVDGVHKVTITTNLPASSSNSKSAVFSSKNITGSAVGSAKPLLFGVNFAANFLPAVT